MVERIIIGSGNIVVPIAIVDKEDPDKLHDVNLQFDISDKALIDSKKHAEKTNKKLAELQVEYQDVINDDADVNEDNLQVVVEGLTAMIRTLFDGDFGAGKYDEISAIGGGNSFINMFELYSQANEFIVDQINKKAERLAVKSNNKKVKYLKKYKKK